MKLEFQHWPGNTEIMLVEQIGESEVVKDRFFTSATHFYENTEHGMYSGMVAADVFAALEHQLPAPNISGDWAEHHPAMQRYREKHRV